MMNKHLNSARSLPSPRNNARGEAAINCSFCGDGAAFSGLAIRSQQTPSVLICADCIENGWRMIEAYRAEEAKKKPGAPSVERTDPRALGYTGDFCIHCGSDRMRRSGTCSTCESCGSTTGCS
jgi:hypothetical protein